MSNDSVESLRLEYQDVQERLKYQARVMEGLDHKAMQTFRFTILMGVLVVTAASVDQIRTLFIPDTTLRLLIGIGGFIGAGIGFLAAAIYSWIATRISVLEFGPDTKDTETVLDDPPSEKDWLFSALNRQIGQLEENRERLNNDFRYLRYSQMSFVVLLIGLLIVVFSWS